MTLQVNIAWLLTVALVSIRVAGATLFVPVFGPTNVPSSVRVLIAVAFAALLVSSVSMPVVAPASTAAWIVAALTEAMIGAAFAFGLMTAHGATQFAGRILDVQMGFGAASVLNPSAQGVMPLLSGVFSMLMVVVFLALDGHHVLIRALSTSLAAFPPGTRPMLDPMAFLSQASVMFTFGLAFAAPVMSALLLADAALAVFARSMPQLNVLMLSFAAKIILGTVGLALSVSVARGLYEALFASTAGFWDRLATGH